MYYDKDKEEAVKVLAFVVENSGDANVALLGGIMSALYDIANELHELNDKFSKESKNDFETNVVNG